MNKINFMQTSNFEFLEPHNQLLFKLTRAAEQAFVPDPNTSLIKARQIGEVIAKDIANRVGVEFDERISQLDLLKRIQSATSISKELGDTFHAIRKIGNQANHQYTSNHHEAIQVLRLVWQVCVWYHKTFNKPPANWSSGAFKTPDDPGKRLREMEERVVQLEREKRVSQDSLEAVKLLKEAEEQKAEEKGKYLNAIREEADIWQQIATELEDSFAQAQKEIQAQQARVQQLQKEKSELVQQQFKQAKAAVKKSKWVETEAETRIRIDQQLRDAGWQADTELLNYSKGERPEAGVNKAIAEWPTADGRADYILFCGLVPIATVEAKRSNTDVSSKIPQAQRYSRGFPNSQDFIMAWQEEGRTVAWPDEEDRHFHIPFVYSANGRPYIKQFKEKSGIWFRDVREGSNLADAHYEFHSPKGLIDKLKRSKAKAEELLQKESFGYLGLRDYQEKAVKAVENALAKGVREALLAMATGTGKTLTINGLIYRLLKSERFKRILFIVDRDTLGTQAYDKFVETKLEQNQSLGQIYNINNLSDKQSDAETRVHVATVQSLVRRIDSDSKPPIDTYDCIIVDEAHRGYTLDQEMGEGEALVRDSKQYLSAYRRVLDYFDAFKVGLTATPAAHTTEVFGHPVYTYSYREAVADDWLIDHEPPIQYITELNRNGIQFERGAQVDLWDNEKGELDSAELEDEMRFNVEKFNRDIITPQFDAVIAQSFVKKFDPLGDEKAMVFCMSQPHAERFKITLDKAFKDEYGEDYNEAAVQILTGKTDKIDEAVKRYKNERYPSVAITVDLLTTGIDVPAITHLLFMRRVKSRILYEQMKGRATRRCDEIGKTVFYIHDPVGLYEALEEVDTMKPVVKDPNISLEQLIEELQNPDSFTAPGSMPNTSHADDVLNQISQKIMRVTRKAQKISEQKPQLKNKLDELQELWQVEPHKLHKTLHDMGPKRAAEFFNNHINLINQLEDVKQLIGTAARPIYFDGQDQLLEVTQSFGHGVKEPGDFLDEFNQYIKKQVNDHAALKVVCTRPGELTRQQLQEVRLLLDNHGYSEANLKSAWRNKTNQQVASSIIGFIRQAALGEPLMPFAERVTKAMDRIYAKRDWSANQKRWLDRLAKQLIHDIIIDQDTINDSFGQDGGYNRLDRVLEGELGHIVTHLKDHLWSEQ